MTAVLAAGDFPRRGTAARDRLERADRVVCCDGAADAYRRHCRREPDAVVGDGDSVRRRFANAVCVSEQETNDLEKAVRWCRARGWNDLVIFGATGKRPDHAIGNVFRALALGVDIAADDGAFRVVRGRATFAVRVGAAVSVFAPDPSTRMTSKGLAWPLDGVRFDNLYGATLNRATSARVSLTATAPVSVFIGGDRGRRGKC